MLSIPVPVIMLLEKLHGAGYEAFLVGGCVRDAVIGRKTNDYDITTSAVPDEVTRVFDGYKVIETGLKHGTVTVLTEGIPVEITTYRSDGSYSDNRHPDSVLFSKDLETDLQRRDFTVNTLCYDGERIYDLLGGMKDIENRVIRCVGDPDRRFGEDALRILRALRFSSVLGFEIDPETEESVIRNRELLSGISGERIRCELEKLLCGDHAAEVVQGFGTVFSVFFPGFDENADRSYLASLNEDHIVRLASLLLGNGRYKDCLRRLKLDNKTYSLCTKIIENYAKVGNVSKIQTLYYLNSFENALLPILRIKQAKGENVFETLSYYNEIASHNDCYKIGMLKIGGDELIKLGISGKNIGKTLDLLLKEVMEQRLNNEKNELISYIKEHLT